MHVVIIGGSDAGIAAALRARELDGRVQITVLLADDYPNFSICGLPYLIGGEVPDWRKLAHRTTFPDIDIRQRHCVRTIDAKAKTIHVEHKGVTIPLRYDRLIIATGARPVRPDIPGADLPGVFLLHTMGDGLAIVDHLQDEVMKSAVIVGAGYIGLELAEALHRRGLDVTLLSRSAEVMPSVNSEIGAMIHKRLIDQGIKVHTCVDVKRIDESLIVTTSEGARYPADLVLLATGVAPVSELAAKAGARLGPDGSIEVSATMATSLPDVFAAGDCAATKHRLLRKPTWISLGTIAHKQGRIAGENALGGSRTFDGIVGTQSLKLFDLVIARTGLSEDEASSEGHMAMTVRHNGWDHKAYYPGSTELGIWITGDRFTGRLLGMQVLGHHGAEVSKRIDLAAIALFQGAQVEELNDYDLSYTPPLSSPWDPIQEAAQAWSMRA